MDQVEQALRRERVVGYAAGAFDGLVEVRDDAVLPASDLVAEDP
jgi:hypothetical protein